MNERIKQLALQAGLLPREIGPVVETRHMKKKQQDLEKFAEKIVRECADICNKIYFDRYPDAEEWERSEEGDAIKKHFGIE